MKQNRCCVRKFPLYFLKGQQAKISGGNKLPKCTKQKQDEISPGFVASGVSFTYLYFGDSISPSLMTESCMMDETSIMLTRLSAG